ncbi:MAG TPA: hypothetical protein VF331_17995 [Polyangiales bacterium]
MLDGLSTAGVQSTGELANIVKKLNDRWFIMRDAHAKHGPVLLQPRWTMTFMRGPMTRVEIRRARGV